MKKNSQKGFMLAEAFIVSTFVLGVLVFMFIQIRTIITGFDRSFTYDTVPGMYITNELVKFIKDNDYNNTLNTVDSTGYILKNVDSYSGDVNFVWNNILKNGNIKNVIVCKENAAKIKNDTTGIFSKKLIEYTKTLRVDNYANVYRVIVEFNDETYASVQMF